MRSLGKEWAKKMPKNLSLQPNSSYFYDEYCNLDYRQRNRNERQWLHLAANATERGCMNRTDVIDQAITLLYEARQGKLIGYIWRRGDTYAPGRITWEDAEDIAQDSFCILRSKLIAGTYADLCDGLVTSDDWAILIPVLYGIAKFGGMGRCKKENREIGMRADTFDIIMSKIEDTSEFSAPLDRVIAKERREVVLPLVHKDLAGLPTIAVEIGIRRWGYHRSVKNIAADLGIPYEQARNLSWVVKMLLLGRIERV